MYILEETSERTRGFAHTRAGTLPPAALVVPVHPFPTLQSGVERARVHTSSEGTAAAASALFLLMDQSETELNSAPGLSERG